MVLCERKIFCGNRELRLGTRTFVMGILNVTPDSYSDGGLYLDVKTAVKYAYAMLEAGVDVIDVGGESTRPFAQKVLPEEELGRVLPVVKVLVKEGITNLSIDTRNASTAQICLEEGVSWVNDVSAFSYDANMVHVAKKAQCVVLMHALKTPDVMQKGEIVYQDVVQDIALYLKGRVEYAMQNGYEKNKILVDPGIGFGKKLAHNLDLIRSLHVLEDIGVGVLCGLSRKAFIGELAGIKEASQRDYATMGALTWSIASGADMVRVHYVKAVCEMLKVVDAFKYGRQKNENLYETGRFWTN